MQIQQAPLSNCHLSEYGCNIKPIKGSLTLVIYVTFILPGNNANSYDRHFNVATVKISGIRQSAEQRQNLMYSETVSPKKSAFRRLLASTAALWKTSQITRDPETDNGLKLC